MNNKTIKANAIKGCLRREIFRYLHEPEQTIFNVIFSNLLFFVILYFLNSEQVKLLIPGIIIFISFNTIFSNMKMTLFVGRLEKTVSYQLSSCVSRVTLYVIYVFSAILRAMIITMSVLIILSLFICKIGIHHFFYYLLWMLLYDIAFSNISILLTLFMKTWNSVGAVENYLVTPVLYLSGCFFSVEQMPSWGRFVVYINPVFHFFNISEYFFSGTSQFDLRVSAIVAFCSLFLSTATCFAIFRKGIKLLK